MGWSVGVDVGVAVAVAVVVGEGVIVGEAVAVGSKVWLGAGTVRLGETTTSGGAVEFPGRLHPEAARSRIQKGNQTLCQRESEPGCWVSKFIAFTSKIEIRAMSRSINRPTFGEGSMPLA